MKHALRVATVAMILIGGLALTSVASIAAGFREGSVASSGVGSGRPSLGRHGGQRPFFRPVGPFSPFGGPIIFYAPPLMDYGSASTYADPPTSYDLPAATPPPARAAMAVAPAPPPPPMPSVIQYPHGRYELRGDGMTTPYVWVWIPNPPPPPPAAAAAPSSSPASGNPSPERHSQVYRWTDAQGVKHFTDRWDAIPAQYRAQADGL
jgi:hypothetical protein